MLFYKQGIMKILKSNSNGKRQGEKNDIDVGTFAMLKYGLDEK